jgi:hypothetical protein
MCVLFTFNSNAKSRDAESQLERARLDLKKHHADMKKKDKLIADMREHVLEVKNMLKKLAEKCRSLEYVNDSQHKDLLEAQEDNLRLKDELLAADKKERAIDQQRDSVVSASILHAQNSQEKSESESEGRHVSRKEGLASGIGIDDSLAIDKSVELPEQDHDGDGGDGEVVSRQMFEELLRDFDHVQRDYDVQAERVADLDLQIHELEEALEREKEANRDHDDTTTTNLLSVDGTDMSPDALREAYLNQKQEHDESMKNVTISLRIKDKMIDDQNNAIKSLKERHRDDESRVQETITTLEDENEDIRQEVLHLEEQLDQSREQEKHCLQELHTLEEERHVFQEECKAAAHEDLKPYRLAIQEKDDALEKARKELSSICEVVADMKSKGVKKDHEIKHLKKEMEVLTAETEKETNKYQKEKTAKAHLLKDVQKMRSEISQSLINKENVIKDLKKSLKSKKILLLESHEKILHMEQLFGTFQQLAATISAPANGRQPLSQYQQHATSRPVSLAHGDYSLPIPSHLLLNEGELVQTIEKYNNANRGLKESISDMSVVSSDSDDDVSDDAGETMMEQNENNHSSQLKHRKQKPIYSHPKHSSIRRDRNKSASSTHSNHVGKSKPILQSKSPDRSKTRHKNKKLPGANANEKKEGSLAIHLPESHSSPRHVAGRSFTDVEISMTNSANILELSKSDDSTVRSCNNPKGDVYGGSLATDYPLGTVNNNADNTTSSSTAEEEGVQGSSNARGAAKRNNYDDDDDDDGMDTEHSAPTESFHDQFYERYANC